MNSWNLNRNVYEDMSEKIFAESCLTHIHLRRRFTLTTSPFCRRYTHSTFLLFFFSFLQLLELFFFNAFSNKFLWFLFSVISNIIPLTFGNLNGNCHVQHQEGEFMLFYSKLIVLLPPCWCAEGKLWGWRPNLWNLPHSQQRRLLTNN